MARAKVRKISLVLKCDFCNGSENDVALLIAAPSGMNHICDACAVICADMVRDEKQK